MYQHKKGHRSYPQGQRGNEEYNFWIKDHSKRNQSRLDEAEDQISELEHKLETNFHKQQQKEKRLKNNEEWLREMKHNKKCNNICTAGIPEEEEEDQRIQNFLKH